MSPEKRRSVLVDQLRNESDWMPVIKDLFSGKYGPKAVDTNVGIWDYETIFQEAYRAVAELPESQRRLQDAVLNLLTSKRQWYRLAAQDLAKLFAIHTAEPLLLQGFLSVALRAFNAKGPSMFAEVSATELTNIARVLATLGRISEIEPVLKQWLDMFVRCSPAFQQWGSLPRRKKDELLDTRELAIASLQILGRKDPTLMTMYFKRIAELGREIHQGCCRFGGEFRLERGECFWVQRSLAGLVDKLGHTGARELLVRNLEGFPQAQIEMVLESLKGASALAEVLPEPT